MKKFENIPKESIYKVPDGYFDRLPGIIQSRIAKPVANEKPFYVMALRYAVPVLVIVFSLIFVVQKNTTKSGDVETMLASISTEALTNYIIDSELTTEELLDEINLAQIDIDELGLETSPIFGLDDIELEDLSNEFETQYF
ncbi:MAG: hypothetical protein HC811_07230 [Flammeovirgaceae bacterium]|nr:hypothetical protein [Flammeovirgaceae bacterium]